MYAIRVPSGDHSASEPFVRKRFFEPSAFITQSDASILSSFWLTQRRV